MKRAMVRYKVKADKAAENERYAQAVFAQLERESPPGIRYATFKLEDGVSFVHLATLEEVDGINPLTTPSSFEAFREQVKERCEVLPVSTSWTEVGNYRFLSSALTARTVAPIVSAVSCKEWPSTSFKITALRWRRGSDKNRARAARTTAGSRLSSKGSATSKSSIESVYLLPWLFKWSRAALCAMRLPQLSLAHLDDQRGRLGLVVAPGLVPCRAWRRLQVPRLVLGARAFHLCHRFPFEGVAAARAPSHRVPAGEDD